MSVIVLLVILTTMDHKFKQSRTISQGKWTTGNNDKILEKNYGVTPLIIQLLK